MAMFMYMTSCVVLLTSLFCLMSYVQVVNGGLSASQKHRNFIAEPMGDKPVTELAGIGEELGRRLADKGFDKAYTVLGQYLVLKKNEGLFLDWLMADIGSNAAEAQNCYRCLEEWCDAFL